MKGLAVLGVVVVLVAGLVAAGLGVSRHANPVADFNLIAAAPQPSPMTSRAVSPRPSPQPQTGQKPAKAVPPGPGTSAGGCQPWQNTLTLNSFRVTATGTNTVTVVAAWSASDSCLPPYLGLIRAVYQRSDGISYLAHYQLPGLVGSTQWSFSCLQATYVTAAQYTLQFQDRANHLAVSAYPQVVVCR